VDKEIQRRTGKVNIRRAGFEQTLAVSLRRAKHKEVAPAGKCERGGRFIDELDISLKERLPDLGDQELEGGKSKKKHTIGWKFYNQRWRTINGARDHHWTYETCSSR